MATTLTNFVFQQGATFTEGITYNDVNGVTKNLTTWTAKMEIKTHPGAATTILTLTETSGVQLASTGPNITITVTAAQTAAMNFERAQYDLVLTDPASGNVVRLIEGYITLDPAVTV